MKPRRKLISLPVFLDRIVGMYHCVDMDGSAGVCGLMDEHWTFKTSDQEEYAQNPGKIVLNSTRPFALVGQRPRMKVLLSVVAE